MIVGFFGRLGYVLFVMLLCAELLLTSAVADEVEAGTALNETASPVLAASEALAADENAGSQPNQSREDESLVQGDESSVPDESPDAPSETSAQSVLESESSRDIVVVDRKTLASLVGVTEIEVLADVKGQLVSGMMVNPVFPDEISQKVDTTDLLTSVDTGRAFNRDSRAAFERKEQASAQAGQALSFLLPSASIRASRGYEISEPSVQVDPNTGDLMPYDRHIRTDITFTATQSLFDLSTFLEWRRRKAKEEARGEGYRISDGDAYLETVKTYLALVSTRLQADVMRDFEKQLSELLEYIEKRADAGASSISDLSRVKARSQATRSSRLEQESAHLAAGTEFVRLTNLVPDKARLPGLEDLGVSLVPETFEDAVNVAMQLNPEITTLVAELKSEQIDKQAALGHFLPHVDLEYTDTYSDKAGGSDKDQRDKRTMLVLNWDLFSGGKDVQLRAERAARYREFKYRLDDQRRRVVQSLASDYAALETTKERIDAGYEELESISTAAEAMSKRMLSGNQSLLDLLDVFDRYYQVRSRLVNLHMLEMNTVAHLVRLTRGTPWPFEEGRAGIE